MCMFGNYDTKFYSDSALWTSSVSNSDLNRLLFFQTWQFSIKHFRVCLILKQGRKLAIKKLNNP